MTCLGAALALPACIVTHDLGETAEDTGGASEDTGGTEMPPDPSATSGVPTSATSGEADEPPDPSVGSDGTDGTDGDPTTGDTGDPGCEQDPEYARWLFNGQGIAPLQGIDPQFAAILTGPCTVGEVVETPGQEGDPTWTIPLQCTLSGRLDADVMFEGDASPVIEMTGTVPAAEVVDSIGDQVWLSVVLEWWGMGWNGWVMLEDGQGAPVLDLFDAEYVDPIDSSWGLEVSDMLGGAPWHKGMGVGTTDSQCGGPITKCNDEPMAITAGWIEESPLVLHPYQEGMIGTPFPEQQMRVSVTSAHATPMPTCTDTPLASYAMAAWAVTP
ncbi:hypothetical protein [Paraliomyxa miuraensis]|uniref:hypothetical protein n=1 Tax=Paraliomyxa miuraensis TaxID=376150 RepID=UPI0022552B78|nr:hypothetical protein [Paraliomyxa miuraensis]MCX4241582.1 hypothetical protein [Paraliomyxa miuraensis]